MLFYGDGIDIFGALVWLFGARQGSPAQADELVFAPSASTGDDDETDWPDDWDAVPGWRLDAEEIAARTGLTLPGYRTRRDYEAAVALCRAALEPEPAPPERAAEPEPNPEPIGPELPALPVALAASAFLDHLTSLGSAVYSNERLTELYLGFCRAQNRAPSPENFMRHKLRRMPGVTTDMVDSRDHDGKRVRQTQWTVSTQPLAMVA